MKQVNKELVEVVKMDLERVTEELKDEETSLKEEQVEEPVPADPLGIRDESSDDSASQSELQNTTWCKDLLLNTFLANNLSKLEEKEATAISNHLKNSAMSPLVHPLTFCLNTTSVLLHLHLKSTVDSTLKEEVKQVDIKRKWMERLRQRKELKNLTDSSDEKPTDVSRTDKSDLLLSTTLVINLSQLEDKEAKAISSHLKNSGHAQYQDYELLLMKMKKKWARKLSEMSAVRRPLVHLLTSCLHTDDPFDLHLHLNSTVDSTLKEELKQMDMNEKVDKMTEAEGGA
ncbi:hypothetical protein AOLI_G00226470 [Acnodon oligacanthus]